MFTEIIPFYFVLDKKIIKICTLQFLEIQENSEVILADRNSSGSSVHDNSIDLENDEESKGRGGSDDKALLGGRMSPIRRMSRSSSVCSEDDIKFNPLRLTNNGHNVLQDSAVQQERARLEQSLTVKESDLVRGEPFTTPWYPNDRKFLKTKLGALFNCSFKNGE